MGIVWVLTSIWLALSTNALSAAQPAVKHKRGQGLLPPSPTAKAKPAKRPTPSKVPFTAENVSRATPASLSCQVPVPLDKLFQQPEVRLPAQAAEGAFYFKVVAGSRELFQQTTARGPAQSVFTPALPAVTHYHPLPPERRHVLALAEGESESTAHMPPLSFPGVESAHWSKEGKWFVFTSHRRGPDKPDLTRWERATGKETLLGNLPGPYRVVDVSDDGKKILMARSDSPAQITLAVWNLEQKELLSAKVSAASETAFFSRDAQGIFFLTPSPHRGATLSFWNLKTAKAKSLTESDRSIAFFSLSPDRKRLVYSEDLKGFSKLGAWEISEEGSVGRKLLLPDVEGVVLDNPAVLPAREKGEVTFFYTLATPTKPSQLWLWTGTQKELWTPSVEAEQSEGCWSHAQVIDNGPHGPSGFLYLPQRTQGPVPFVIYSEHREFKPRFVPAIQYLTQRGFGVFAPQLPPGKDDYSAVRQWLIQKKLAPSSAIFFQSRAANPDSELMELRQAVEGFELALQVEKKN